MNKKKWNYKGATIFEWLTNFSDREIRAPFVVAKDEDYYDDLRKRLTHFVNLLEDAGADSESNKIAKKYSDKICECLRDYYRGNISSCHQKIENLIKGCDEHIFAVAELNKSKAFPEGTDEIQFFRARTESVARVMQPKDMLHLPFSMRSKSGNYRFSIPGVTSLYLANTSYGCWIEMGKPSEHDFYAAPVLLDGKQKIFNLAVSSRLLYGLNDGAKEYVHCWIKLLVLMIATSYKVKEENRTFRSEYIVSQSIMLACKKLGYDGVVYFSKCAETEDFALVAINLALFADYKKGRDFGEICKHMKVDEPLNYQLFRQLNQAVTYRHYPLRVGSTGFITNINGYKRQYSYKDTEFYRFDQHLFSRWTDKDEIEWGNALEKK